jgi:hypothetical protein
MLAVKDSAKNMPKSPHGQSPFQDRSTGRPALPAPHRGFRVECCYRSSSLGRRLVQKQMSGCRHREQREQGDGYACPTALLNNRNYPAAALRLSMRNNQSARGKNLGLVTGFNGLSRQASKRQS